MKDKTWLCPFCSYELSEDATFCPRCGSDENTGWSQESDYDQNDLADHDYEASLKEEFGDTERDRAFQVFMKTVILLTVLFLTVVLLGII
ncbi:MAG: zinc-ribbon domain-containing protein [Fibrobacterota bacterium]